MRRNIMWVGLLWLTFSSVAYAKSHQVADELYDHHASPYQFGPVVGIGFESSKLGFFGEYNMEAKAHVKGTWGWQLAILHFRNKYFVDFLHLRDGSSALVQISCISIPIVFKWHSRDDGSSWNSFGGLQLGYVIDANFRFKAEKSLDDSAFPSTLVDSFKGIDFTGLQEIAGQTTIRRLQIAYLVGFEYMFERGFILGYTWTYELIPIIAAPKSFSMWSSQISLGYNLAKLAEECRLREEDRGQEDASVGI